MMHTRVATRPNPLALEFADRVRSAPRGVRVKPGDRHGSIFRDLRRGAKAEGRYARLPGLRWKSPF